MLCAAAVTFHGNQQTLAAAANGPETAISP